MKLKSIVEGASKQKKIEIHGLAWEIEARSEQQIPEGNWQTWILIAGRGFGKTRTGAETTRILIERGEVEKAMLVSKNPQDAREDMIEDMDSGLLACCSPHYKPEYEPGNKRILWPDGQVAHIRTGAKPDNIRGGGYDLVWMDELAAWDYPQETYDQIQFVCRRGDPKQIITTTPKRIQLIKDLKEESEKYDDVVLTSGSMYDNEENLSKDWVKKMEREYEGSTLGRQEIHAEIITEEPGALWSRKTIQFIDEAPDLERIVVAIDPATSNKDESDETGIMVAGKRGDQFYVLDDLSCKASPKGWASKAVTAYHEHEADKIIAETNQGGDMVESTIKEIDDVPFKQVKASRGKQIRAEPIAALYEQDRVFHTETFSELETQLTTWEPGDESPDRLDALVWALSELKEERKQGRVF